MERLNEPLPVPSTAIYSRSDGVVAWQCCIDVEADTTENVEVRAATSGCSTTRRCSSSSPTAWRSRKGGARPFEPPGWNRFFAQPAVPTRGTRDGSADLMARMSRMDAAFLATERPNAPSHLGMRDDLRPR